MAELKFQATLAEVQADPDRISGLGVTTLAWLMHEVESTEPPDDVTFMRLQNEHDSRSYLEQKIIMDEYRRLWPIHHGSHKAFVALAQKAVKSP